MKKNNKKLSKVQQKRLEVFNNVRNKLIEEGYREKFITITLLKVNIMVLVTTVPICIICTILFWTIHMKNKTFFIENTRLLGVFWITIFIGIIIHELIHGVFWAFSTKKKWKSIGFGVDWGTLTPYCTCNEELKLKNYAIGAAMPTIILGIMPYLIGLITGNLFLALFGIVQLMGGGGDVYILWLIRKEKNVLLLDHPYLVGCVSFKKE